MQYAASEPETIEAAWIASHMPRRSPPRNNNNIALTPLIGFAYCLGAKLVAFLFERKGRQKTSHLVSVV